MENKLNFEKCNVHFTPFEKAALEELLVFHMDAEPGFSAGCVQDVAKGIGQTIRVTRGIIGSLCKKNVVYVEDVGAECPIIYLEKAFWFLHPDESWHDEEADYLDADGETVTEMAIRLGHMKQPI